ncbi:putative peptidylprolyl isomerase [Rosa chinensis]|uniref:Putative peptidylprolyl isomerase n=1 Tax=Rosa chinensis TaxID=74649 RepID=A0A2P6QF37_ROSCH|nr:rhodanese-like/PpiC domain-containing protein 12, chloroplastic [Rosa chinensis]PRQ32802.1 putative peptidylprolyl isomerase [Rosa chinensis]
MLRISHLTLIAPPAFSALRLSLTSTLNLSTPLNLHKISTCSALYRLSQTFKPTSPSSSFLSANRVLLRVMGSPGPKGSASFSAESSSGDGREILVQHLLVKEDNLKLLLDLQQRVSRGEDLSDLAAEYSICPSKEEGGMLGWVRKGQMVPEFEEAAFSASLNKVVRCKTKFGWHLLQVLSEREESVLQNIQCKELHVKMQDPSFLDEAQLIDVREPEEVAQASLSGFQVLPLRQFGSWGPDITTKFDPQKDTYVMCHHGMRSLQVAQWLQTQGFKRVFNVAGGIHEYARTVDQTIPTY